MSSAAECPSAGRSLPRLLRPAILAFLAQGEAHGYQIAQHLSGTRLFADREPDHPGVYRALNEMVDQGLATHSWQASDAGPARKVFALTPAGECCLDTWLATLSEYRDAIDDLLSLLRQGKSVPAK